MNITYEQLMFALDHGEEVTFQDEYKLYMTIGGAGKDQQGLYRSSGWCKTIEQCQAEIGVKYGYPHDLLKERVKTLELLYMRKRIARWYYIHIICKETEQTFYEGPRPVGAVRKMREIDQSVDEIGLIKTIIQFYNKV